ncbi:DMT family transporter [Pseudidiomarina terrestris]|uniref:DMT family transporter n=1 Tax=Pseudidiomarina terrestris TaxID=2820060 RepID=UPI0026549EB9|nr:MULTISPECIES: DMT family transporter [unclassified Pseudidiomarina]MDN7135313.1 DMT family transporter [Pseudidiomarina sp. 1ASP75-5]MDN7138628.1 DMT family transporter [Pseudidiomarina sp. 1ASP75-14]MEA3586917.1 DMT family transporter [Pseudidiomarina sp. 1APP75-27a]
MDWFIGPLAALFAALFWALATLLYSQAGSYLSASQLNLVKGFVAVPLLFMVGLATSQLVQFDGSAAAWLLLASGVIGITLGDTLYFTALRRIGPWHTMLFEYLAPPFAAIIAWVWLREAMSFAEISAALVVLFGILVIVTERGQRQGTTPLTRAGAAAATGAALCQALGLVMAFEALVSFDVNPLQAAFVRLAAGTAALTVALLLLKPSIILQTRSALRHTSLPWLFVAIVMGTFLAIWLQQTAIAYLHPGLAQTLLATAPLWLIPIQWFRGEPPSVRSILGALIAVTGIALLFSR